MADLEPQEDVLCVQLKGSGSKGSHAWLDSMETTSQIIVIHFEVFQKRNAFKDTNTPYKMIGQWQRRLFSGTVSLPGT